MRSAPHHRLGMFAVVILLTALLASLVPVTPQVIALAAAAPNSAAQPDLRSGQMLIHSGGYLSDPAPGDPEAIARDFIDRSRHHFGLSAADLADLHWWIAMSVPTMD
ncbi:MAG: hypothetical protein HC822_09970 [Oscillochloris sp.]|nr:hypothetical protein [Oscillochloris sp.]